MQILVLIQIQITDQNDHMTRVLDCRHLAAAEGCFSVVEWLLSEARVSPNPVDRFSRTPLEVWMESPQEELRLPCKISLSFTCIAVLA